MNQSTVLIHADMCLITEVPSIALFHLMGIRIPLLFLILSGRRSGNDGGIHNRSLFQNQPTLHEHRNYLREQLLL